MTNKLQRARLSQQDLAEQPALFTELTSQEEASAYGGDGFKIESVRERQFIRKQGGQEVENVFSREFRSFLFDSF